MEPDLWMIMMMSFPTAATRNTSLNSALLDTGILVLERYKKSKYILFFVEHAFDCRWIIEEMFDAHVSKDNLRFSSLKYTDLLFKTDAPIRNCVCIPCLPRNTPSLWWINMTSSVIFLAMLLAFWLWNRSSYSLSPVIQPNLGFW